MFSVIIVGISLLSVVEVTYLLSLVVLATLLSVVGVTYSPSIVEVTYLLSVVRLTNFTRSSGGNLFTVISASLLSGAMTKLMYIRN